MPEAGLRLRGRRRLACAPVAAAGLLAVMIALAPPAAAHPALTGADPAPGSIQQRQPPLLTLRFVGEVDGTRSRLALSSGSDGRRTPLPVSPSSGRLLQADLPPLRAGLYVVRYDAAGVDGHILSGDYRFVVWPAGTPAPAGLSDLERRSSGIDESAGVPRSVAVVASLPLVGLLAAGLLLAGRRGHRPPRLLRRALLGVGLATFAADAVVAGLTGAEGRYGRLMVLHAVLVGVLVVLVHRRTTGRLAATVGLLTFVPLALTSHDVALSARPFAAAAVDWLHLGAAALWIGGVSWMLLRVAGGERDEMVDDVRRFARVAPAVVLVVVATGSANTLSRLPDWAALVRSGYGLVLAAKLGLVSVGLAWAVANRRRLTRLTLTGEGVALAAVMVVTGALISLAPPVRPVRPVLAPVLTSVVLGEDAYSVLVAPARPGTNTLWVRPLEGEQSAGGAPSALLVVDGRPEVAVPLRPAATGWTGTMELPTAPSRLRILAGQAVQELGLPGSPAQGKTIDAVVQVEGESGEECRSRLVGQMAAVNHHNLVGARPTSLAAEAAPGPCELTGEPGHAEAVGRIFGDYLHDYEVGRVAVVVDGGPRAAAFVTGYRAAAGPAAEVAVYPASDLAAARDWGPDAVVVAGSELAAEAVRVATSGTEWLPSRGIFLAPWLLDARFLAGAVGRDGPQISLGLDFDPYGPGSRSYLEAVSQMAPFESPSAIGLEGYLSATRSLAGQPPVKSPIEMQFYAVARVSFLPASLSHGQTSHLWLDDAGLATISGSRHDPGPTTG